jgi:hypothetical protein
MASNSAYTQFMALNHYFRSMVLGLASLARIKYIIIWYIGMCWNEHVSLNTFLFSGFVLGLIIYNNMYTKYKIQELNSIWVYFFFLSFIFMQLIEFFIWRNIDNKYYNRIFSCLAQLLLLVQPLASLMILSNIPLRNTLVMSYLLLAIPFSTYKFATTNIHSMISKNGHLQWKFFNMGYYIWAIWCFFFLFSILYERHYYALLFALITLCAAVINYTADGSVGSLWCWSVNSVFIYYAFHLLIYLPFLEKAKIC